jgi:hypothetical protein
MKFLPDVRRNDTKLPGLLRRGGLKPTNAYKTVPGSSSTPLAEVGE